MTDATPPLGSPGQPLAYQALASASPETANGGPRAAQPAPAAESAAKEEPFVLTFSASAGKEAASPSPSLEEAAEAFREYIEELPTNLQFSVDREAHATVFKVVNPVTREVLRQYPPEEVLSMARRLRALGTQEAPSGILLDQEL